MKHMLVNAGVTSVGSRMSSEKDWSGRGFHGMGTNHTPKCVLAVLGKPPLSRGMTSLAARMAFAAMHGRTDPRSAAPKR